MTKAIILAATVALGIGWTVGAIMLAAQHDVGVWSVVPIIAVQAAIIAAGVLLCERV